MATFAEHHPELGIAFREPHHVTGGRPPRLRSARSSVISPFGRVFTPVD